MEGHSRPVELRRLHPFGIMVGIVLDKKEIDALERRAELLQAGAAGVDKASKGSYRRRNAHRAKNPLSSQDSDFEKVSILLTTTKPTLDAFMKPPESRRRILVSPFTEAYIQAEKTEIETHIKN